MGFALAVTQALQLPADLAYHRPRLACVLHAIIARLVQRDELRMVAERETERWKAPSHRRASVVGDGDLDYVMGIPRSPAGRGLLSRESELCTLPGIQRFQSRERAAAS